jgi:hypothetical protein
VAFHTDSKPQKLSTRTYNGVNLDLPAICTNTLRKPRDSPVVQRWATGWMIGRGGGFEYRQGLEIFLFDTMSRPALEPTQPPNQGVPGALSLGVKRPGCEANHSPPSSAKVNNVWRYISTPPIRLHGVVFS